MKLFRLQAIGSFLLAAMLSAPMWGANPALPGTLNYVEGQATVGDQTLDAKSVGSVNLVAGQTLSTRNGKAEVLLTPGVFVRVGDNSSLQMISPNLADTTVALPQGSAMVEVAELYKQNLIQVQQGNATTQLLKTGLYAFNSSPDSVRVLKGEAVVQDGDQRITVKGGHELDLAATGKLKTTKFDQNAVAQSDLYRFSALRSQYLAEANAGTARIYVAGGPGWYGPGWYWSPWYTAYTWIPGDGMFYSPFGWGFYSPGWAWRAPYYGVSYRHFGPGYTARVYSGGVPRAAYAPHVSPHAAVSGGRSFGAVGGGFHGGGGSFHGGGVR